MSVSLMLALGVHDLRIDIEIDTLLAHIVYNKMRTFDRPLFDRHMRHSSIHDYRIVAAYLEILLFFIAIVFNTYIIIFAHCSFRKCWHTVDGDTTTLQRIVNLFDF